MSAGLVTRLRQDERVAFLAAGAFNTGFGFGVFAGLLVTLGRVVPYLVVLLVAHVVAVLVAFVVYRRGVFKVEGNVLVDLLRFESVYLVSLAVNLVLLPVLHEVAGLPVLLAQALIVFVTALISFFGHKHFSFRRAAA